MAIKIGTGNTRILTVIAVEPCHPRNIEHKIEVEFNKLPMSVWSAHKTNETPVNTLLPDNCVIKTQICGDNDEPLSQQELLDISFIERALILGFSAVQEGITNDQYLKARIKNS